MRIFSTILTFFFTAVAWHGASQSFTIYNYSVPEGLPSSEVYEVFQDSRGFLWFATDNGVTKFDGRNFQNYHVKDGLSDPVVFSFFEDSKHRLWFRTFSGKISYLENDSIKLYPYNDRISLYTNRGLLNFIVTKTDHLIFTSREFRGTLTPKGELFVEEITDEGVFYEEYDNDHLIGISDHLFPLDQLIIKGKIFPITISDATYQNRVFRATYWNGRLYLSMNKEVFEYDGSNVRKVLQSDKPVISIATDNSGHLWVGYMNGGVERYSDFSFKNPWKPEFLKARSVTKVFNDVEGGLWFSTLENGVYHVPNLLIQHFPSASNSRLKGVLGFDDHALVGDQTGRVYRIDADSKKSSTLLSLEGPVISLHSDDQNFWVSTSAMLRLFDKQFKLKQEFIGVVNDYARTKTGETYAFGGYRFRRFDQKNNQAFMMEIDVPFRSIHAVDTIVMAADRLGLQLRTQKMKLIKTYQEFSTMKISNILPFSDSVVLITTIGKGFILMNQYTGHHRIYNTQNDFLADHIYSSLMDDSLIWLGTEKGLIKLRKSELKGKKFRIEYLTKKSGLISDKIDFLTKVGTSVWAFSDNMFSVIPATFTQFAKSQPLFYIEQIRVNDKIVPKATTYSLPHDNNNIEVSYRYISFNNPNILLRYRTNHAENWNYTTNNKILFTSLAPGHYDFDLQYSSNNQDWVSAFPDLAFNIEEPWYGRWYNQVIALVVILCLGAGYFRYQSSIYKQKNHYLKIINEHQQKLIQSEIVTLERERNRIAKELHDRVGTNLTAIKMTVNQILQHHKDQHAADVEEQFQIALREIKEIIYALTPPSLERYGLFTSLRNYIGKLNKNIPINISLKTFGKDVGGTDLNIILFRVLQELLNNSIKHSFAKNITIHINSFDDVLNVMYEDDGIGFSYDPLQSGLGLDNIESRIHSVHGTLKFESGKFGISYTIDIPITINKEVA